jgi:hypothetical protein
MNRVETSQGSTRSRFNCDTGVFVSKTTSSDLRVERTHPVPKLAGWIPPNEVVQLVVDDQVGAPPRTTENTAAMCLVDSSPNMNSACATSETRSA